MAVVTGSVELFSMLHGETHEVTVYKNGKGNKAEYKYIYINERYFVCIFFELFSQANK